LRDDELAPPHTPAPTGDLTSELLGSPDWTDQRVAAAAIPMCDVPFLAVGGGTGSFVTLDHPRIYGVPTPRTRVVSTIDHPWQTYESRSRRSRIPGKERIRSGCSSRPDDLWKVSLLCAGGGLEREETVIFVANAGRSTTERLLDAARRNGLSEPRTRHLFLLAGVGVIVTPLIVPVLAGSWGSLGDRHVGGFPALVAVGVLGIVHHFLMRLRREKGRPTPLGLPALTAEGLVLYFLLRSGAVDFIGPVLSAVFWTHFALVWECMRPVANGPMRVPFIRWRFRGGRVL
jgi:hypothetical protein